MNKIILGSMMLLSILATGFFSADWSPRGLGGGWRLPLVGCALLLSGVIWTFCWRISSANLLAAVVLLFLPPALCFGASVLSEHLVSWTKESENQVEIQKIRAELKAGNLNRACEIVYRDKNVTDSEMKQCWSNIDGAQNPQDKWKVLSQLLNGLSIGTRFVSFEHAEPIVPADKQVWFVRELYSNWLKQPGALETEASLNQAYWLLYSLAFGNGLSWTEDARDVFQKEIIPLYRQEINLRTAGKSDLMKPVEDFKQSLEQMEKFPGQQH